jgi:CheY-like chemotaxis protein
MVIKVARTILVADDSPTIQRHASGILIAEGIEVVSVSNGVAAIKKLPAVRPLLILADVSMPGKDGYEVCEFAKTSTELCHIPVLLTCSEFEPYHEDRGTEVQAGGCVKKPFNHDNLISAVTKCLAQSELAQPTAFFPSPPSVEFESIPSAELAEKTAAPEPQPGFDLTTLSKGVALTEPMGESSRRVPADEIQNKMPGPDSQMFQSGGGTEPPLAQDMPSGSEETNDDAEESDEFSASSRVVDGAEFSDSEPALSGASSIFPTSERAAGLSEDNAAVQIPERKYEPEVQLPEIAFPSNRRWMLLTSSSPVLRPTQQVNSPAWAARSFLGSPNPPIFHLNPPQPLKNPVMSPFPNLRSFPSARIDLHWRLFQALRSRGTLLVFRDLRRCKDQPPFKRNT